MYSVLLSAIVYHAFISLFLDCTGSYEVSARKALPATLAALAVVVTFLVAPSAIYARVRTASALDADFKYSHFHQYCALEVPSLVAEEASNPGLAEESAAIYRLVYELILPYLVPVCFILFPYVCLLLGLMKGLSASAHAEYSVKMSVVVTLWLLTTYLMLHVSTVMKNLFSVFSVWHRLVVVLDAYDDERVPLFQTYIHILAYMLTCVWSIARAALCFKYNVRLRKALGP